MILIFYEEICIVQSLLRVCINILLQEDNTGLSKGIV